MTTPHFSHYTGLAWIPWFEHSIQSRHGQLRKQYHQSDSTFPEKNMVAVFKLLDMNFSESNQGLTVGVILAGNLVSSALQLPMLLFKWEIYLWLVINITVVWINFFKLSSETKIIHVENLLVLLFICPTLQFEQTPYQLKYHPVYLHHNKCSLQLLQLKQLWELWLVAEINQYKISFNFVFIMKICFKMSRGFNS